MGFAVERLSTTMCLFLPLDSSIPKDGKDILYIEHMKEFFFYNKTLKEPFSSESKLLCCSHVDVSPPVLRIHRPTEGTMSRTLAGGGICLCGHVVSSCSLGEK